jgi:hypothetical protein
VLTFSSENDPEGQAYIAAFREGATDPDAAGCIAE